MQNRSLFFILLLCFAIVGILPMEAENPVNSSPYSRFGLGRLSDTGFGPSRGMGGVGFGLRSSSLINPLNPASYAALDSITFLFDLGFSVTNGVFQEGSTSENKVLGGLDYIALQFKAAKWLGFSFGLKPFSSTGYNYGQAYKEPVSGTLYYDGAGNFSQIYGGFAVQPFPSFSVGANVNYLFGYSEHTSTTLFDDVNVHDLSMVARLVAKAINFDIGAQYIQKIGKTDELVLGFVYSPEMKFLQGDKMTTEISFSDSEVLKIDTLQNNSSGYSMPAKFSGGVSYNMKDQWLFAADYSHQLWSKALFENQRGMLNDRAKFNAGVEFCPNPIGQNYFSRMRYRFGGHYATSYFSVKDVRPIEWGIGLGLGFPFRNQRRTINSVANISFDYVNVTPIATSLVRENYFRFTVNITFNEYWFFKRKID